MDVFTLEPELTLAVAAAAAFVLGWMAQRWLHTRRDQHGIELLNDRIRKLQQQRDAAHRAALDLAARHMRLDHEQSEVAGLIRSLKSAPGHRYVRNHKPVDGYDVHVSEMTEASWPVLQTVQ